MWRVARAITPLVDVRDVQDTEGDQFCWPPGFETVFHNHDQPVIVGGIEKILKEHLCVFVMVFRVLMPIREAVVPLWVKRHGVDDDIGDGLDIAGQAQSGLHCALQNKAFLMGRER